MKTQKELDQLYLLSKILFVIIYIIVVGLLIHILVKMAEAEQIGREFTCSKKVFQFCHLERCCAEFTEIGQCECPDCPVQKTCAACPTCPTCPECRPCLKEARESCPDYSWLFRLYHNTKEQMRIARGLYARAKEQMSIARRAYRYRTDQYQGCLSAYSKLKARTG